MKHMKHWKRWLLAACALAVGGGLGSVLLADPAPAESSAAIRERVLAARQRQRERMAGLGISYATKKEAHLRMDILPNLFKKLEKPLIVVCDAALVAFAVYLMGPGLNVLTQLAATGQQAASTHVPMYVVYASMWVGLALSIVRILERYVKLLWRRFSRGEQKEE